MKRFIPLLFLLVLPTVLFAQGQPSRETKMLKRIGLNDAQISQVMDIQKKTMTTVRQDMVHIRLLKAQVAQALLPATVDTQAVNNLIDQESQTSADMQKALVGARIQLRQIMGDDIFRMYMNRLMAMRRMHFRNRMQGFGNGRMPQGKGGQDDFFLGGTI